MHLSRKCMKLWLAEVHRRTSPPTQRLLKPPPIPSSSQSSHLLHFWGIYLPTHPSIHVPIDFDKMTSDPSDLRPFWTYTHTHLCCQHPSPTYPEVPNILNISADRGHVSNICRQSQPLPCPLQKSLNSFVAIFPNHLPQFITQWFPPLKRELVICCMVLTAQDFPSFIMQCFCSWWNIPSFIKPFFLLWDLWSFVTKVSHNWWDYESFIIQSFQLFITFYKGLLHTTFQLWGLSVSDYRIYHIFFCSVCFLFCCLTATAVTQLHSRWPKKFSLII